MCGIAGILKLNGESTQVAELKCMTDALHHRGPDGEGQWVGASGNVGFGHRRLSIIDLSDNGKQPMAFAGGRYHITFNGEIYNYIELKKILLAKGYQFRSDSDTEVLLALYDLKKESCLEDLDGMFAFAIWDEKEQSLFCARDRFGEKPFYYQYIPGKHFVFGSEMKALFAYGIKREMSNRMLYNYLYDPIIISDPKNKSETFYNGISKLEQSHYLVIHSGKYPVKKRYWDISETQTDHSMSFEEATGRFSGLFFESLDRRLRSDVPVGSSLSGGLDSSSIVCGIKELMGNKTVSQNSFSARFRNFSRDEGEYIEKVVSKTGIAANYTWPDGDGFMKDFEKLCFHQEEPFPSASIYAQFAVMRLAKEKNVTVLLDGQGADEMLGGYEYYFNTFLKELFLKKDTSYRAQYVGLNSMHPKLLLEDYETPGAKIAMSPAELVKSAIRPVYKLLNPTKYKRIHEKSYAQLQRESLFTPDFSGAFNGKDVFDMKGSYTTLNGHLKHSFFVSNLEDLLRFSDRNSMAFSREVRLPFLYHKLVEFVFQLPAAYKINEGWSKYILRKSFENILPPEITWRKEKVGYEPPQKVWMDTKQVNDIVNDSKSRLIKDKILKPDAVLTDDQKFAALNMSYFS